ncbi:hypothetical protein AB0M29_04890 [Streptomyces sp. NPDC051976]|uniref:hypothetical protein n=1 Tax=Streptomyces sp. NPDC051976 TaxID=3154947 RepID=UPI0034314112
MSAAPGQQPPPGAALSLPATRQALRRYAARSAGLALAGLAVVVAAALGLASSPHAVRPVLVFLLSSGLLPLGGGLVSLANVPRMRRLMARHPWRVWDGSYQVLPLGGGQPALLPAGPGGRLLAVVAWRWNWRVLGIRQHQVWYAGDPLHGPAVAAPPGGSVLLWARPARRFRRLRRSLAGDQHIPGDRPTRDDR